MLVRFVYEDIKSRNVYGELINRLESPITTGEGQLNSLTSYTSFMNFCYTNEGFWRILLVDEVMVRLAKC